jgi:hypothetical protein
MRTKTAMKPMLMTIVRSVVVIVSSFGSVIASFQKLVGLNGSFGIR